MCWGLLCATPVGVKACKAAGRLLTGESCCPLRCDWRAEVYALMERGAAARATGATKLNEISSRSHGGFSCWAADMTCLSAVNACRYL